MAISRSTRRSERASLFDTPAGFDDPLEMLLGCHRRIERQLETDHRELGSAWARLRKPLEAIGEGLVRALPPDDVHAFVSGYAHHILTEETALREFFNRWLDRSDLESLGRTMAARRSPTR